MTLHEPFVTHKGITRGLAHLLVKIEWCGLVGYGIAIPTKESDATIGSVESILERFAQVIQYATDVSPLEHQKILHHLDSLKPNHPAALAAIDMALWDLFGKYKKLPLYKLLGVEKLSLPKTALSIGIAEEEVVLLKVKKYINWPILKFKMSAPNKSLIEKIHEIYPGKIWVDGNGAWSQDEAVSFAEETCAYNVDIIEQPVPPGQIEDLHFVTRNSPIKIIADEDCVNINDVEKLANHVDGINIKLVKCGGISHALNMIKLAKQYNLKVMLGCKTESALGVTAMAHLGGVADFLDLDGHLDICNDPFQGVVVHEGTIQLPSNFGLGVIKQAEGSS